MVPAKMACKISRNYPSSAGSLTYAAKLAVLSGCHMDIDTAARFSKSIR